MSIKRLRIFAGPNGSGKSTLVKVVSDLQVHLGVYVNADELKIELDREQSLDFKTYSILLNIEHLRSALLESIQSECKEIVTMKETSLTFQVRGKFLLTFQAY